MGKVIKLVAGYYETMYHRMFNAATDAIWEIENVEGNEKVEKAKEMLIRAQQDCEEIYISAGEDDETNENENKTEDETE